VSDGESAPRSTTPPSSGQAELPPAGGNGERPLEEMSVGELVFEVSDRASLLIREEIELAKTEVTEKVNRILRGSVVGLVAGVFLVIALMLAMFGVAWFLNDEVFNNLWLGFFVEAGAFVLIAAGAGFYAFRAFKRGAPPTPEMAIEEAKEIKAAFDGGEEPS
jgi:putative superfamily III holin-X